jgi:predicted transposase/invertase (TIGR01784 family)
LVKVFFEENDDLIDIRRDKVFKAVFTKEIPASRTALSNLVSTLIEREITVTTIKANEPPIESLEDRQIRFDINCKAENGELINVEMGFNPAPFEPIRLEFHAGKLFTGQDIRGSDKSYNDLKRAYQIAILAKERFFTDEAVFHCFEYYDREHQVTLKGRSRIITVELEKLDNIVEKPTKEMNAQEHWGVFFQYLTDKGKREKINEIIAYEEGIAMASEVLISISKDEAERFHLMSEYKYELDTQSRLVEAKREAKREGREEGLDEGLEQGREITARNLLGMGMSIEETARATELPVEKVRSLASK